MFKRTSRLFQIQKDFGDVKHKKILDYYTPNDELLKNLKMPYELRGEYLPRRKINPFKKRPLNVTYDYQNFNSFVLPSRRDEHFHMFNQEELFGIKKWRNDSPYIREYIRVDNQIFLIFFLIATLTAPFIIYHHRLLLEYWDNFLTSDMGALTSDDVK